MEGSGGKHGIIRVKKQRIHKNIHLFSLVFSIGIVGYLLITKLFVGGLNNNAAHRTSKCMLLLHSYK